MLVVGSCMALPSPHQSIHSGQRLVARERTNPTVLREKLVGFTRDDFDAPALPEYLGNETLAWIVDADEGRSAAGAVRRLRRELPALQAGTHVCIQLRAYNQSGDAPIASRAQRRLEPEGCGSRADSLEQPLHDRHLPPTFDLLGRAQGLLEHLGFARVDGNR